VEENNSKKIVDLIPRIVKLLNWLEDCNDLFMQLIRNPAGIGFPNEELLETKIHCDKSVIQVGDLSRLLVAYPQDNIWRSCQLFSDKLCKTEASYVPFFLDIDNSKKNLEYAYSLTRDCLDLLGEIPQFQGLDRMRVVFSGMKGFHIEGKPTEIVDSQVIRTTLLRGLKRMGRIPIDCSNYFQAGVIDPIHDFIRVTGSINSWKSNNILLKRKVIQLSVDEFRRAKIKNILEKSEI